MSAAAPSTPASVRPRVRPHRLLGEGVLRRQGVPVHRGGALGDRSRPQHRRVQRRRARRRARRRRRRRSGSASTATTSRVAEIDRAVQVGIGVDRARQPDRDRAGRRRRASATDCVQPVRLRVNSGVHAHTHEYLATAREDQKFGIALDGCRGCRRRDPRARPRWSSSDCTVTSARRSSARTDSPSRRRRLLELHAVLLDGRRRARAQPRRRIRHRLHARSITRCRSAELAPAAGRHRAVASARGCGSRCPSSPSSPAGRSSGRRR